ncbi:MAG: DNA-protecting protein DprA [Crocinitomicaceae bacterium]|nr:DNA-protecting protein DprA [Crocinitomicaceae bacterium]|tara:strand:- start:31200 stop:32276 length:1077 start_codon:yes stop_codon:yes gene_type:complete
MVPGIGPIKAKNLIRYCGNAEAVFTEKKSRLLKIPEVGESVINAIVKHNVFDLVEKELRFIGENKLDVLYYQDAAFPKRLLHCPDHPLILFKTGNYNFDANYVISIVGTRKATPYGREVCNELLDYLKPFPITMVSGLAYGIDIYAHAAALRNEVPNIGVVAHGLDQVYPREHEKYVREMVNNGGLLTEFTSGGRPDKENFPKRNRLVAGLADVILVVESQERGGALITARLGQEYNRDVFAVPGKTTDPYSIGCNNLIFENGAALYPGPEQFVHAMGWVNDSQSLSNAKQQLALSLNLSPLEENIVSMLRTYPKIRKDELSGIISTPVSEVSISLLNLELNGIVKSLPGSRFDLAIA